MLKKDEQNLTGKLPLYLSVLRFGDRMDFIRCSKIARDFPDINSKYRSNNEFNPKLLNLPENASEEFYEHFQAAAHGAVDLATVSGGYRERNDLRIKGSYVSRYNLSIDNKRLKTVFEHTQQPKSKINEIINNNVRRKIASLAGINTCTDSEHATCKADTQNGVMFGIHSTWADLQQVKIPESMSLLEKMQIEHNLEILSAETKDAINNEVARLQKEGIQMQLGSLTQDVLKSSVAQKVLATRGLQVVKENRSANFNSANKHCFEEIFTVTPAN